MRNDRVPWWAPGIQLTSTHHNSQTKILKHKKLSSYLQVTTSLGLDSQRIWIHRSKSQMWKQGSRINRPSIHSCVSCTVNGKKPMPIKKASALREGCLNFKERQMGVQNPVCTLNLRSSCSKYPRKNTIWNRNVLLSSRCLSHFVKWMSQRLCASQLTQNLCVSRPQFWNVSIYNSYSARACLKWWIFFHRILKIHFFHLQSSSVKML